MEYLEHYVEWLNDYPMAKKISYPVTTQEQADKIFVELGNDLSQERLQEDGEASKKEVDEKYRYYVRVIKDLKKLGFVIRGEALKTDGLYGGRY